MLLSHEENGELDAALTEAIGSDGKPNRDSAARAVDLIDAADAAGREWPDFVRREALLVWCFAKQKAIAKRESIVLVSHDGKLIGKATRVGRSVRKADGSRRFDQTLFSDMTWDEVGAWVGLIVSQIEGLTANMSMAARLFAMREQVPDSRGPGDAAAALGTTVAEWIEDAS